MSQKNSHVFSYLTALILAIAAGIGIVCISMVGYSIYEEFASARAMKNIRIAPYEILNITASGTPVLKINNQAAASLDADRQPLAEPLDEPLLRQAHLNRWNGTVRYVVQNSDRERVRSIGSNASPKRWYFVVQDQAAHRGYFVCYDRDTQRLIGYLGRTGFQTEPPSEQFTIHQETLLRWYSPGLIEWNDLQSLYGDYNNGQVMFRGNFPLEKNQLVLRAEEETYLIDLQKRSVEVLPLDKDTIAVGWAGQLTELAIPERETVQGEDKAYELTMYLVAQTPRKLIFFQPGNPQRLEFPLQEEFAGRSYFFLTSDNQLIALAQNLADRRTVEPGVGESVSEYYRINSSGEILDRKEIPHRYPMIEHELEKGWGLNLIVLMVPGTLTSGVNSGVFLPYMMSRGEKSFSEMRKEVLSTAWPALLIATLFSAALCVLVERRQMAYHLPRSYGWLAFVFLLGLPGYIGYLLHRKWPLKEQPKAPVLTGREIFA